MSPPVNKPRILVVEDEAIVARDIRLQLEELGYEPVGHATRGEEAIVLAGELKPDLVLMDIRLVGAMDGIAAAQAIRMQFGLAVVFLTAFAEDETLARAKLAEPLGYILKPFSERELRTVLSIALYKSKTEAKLHRVSQLYAALTACNQAIVRSTSEADLLPQICRDAVTFGGMKMAWVGLVQEASGWVKPVASFGDGDGYLADIRITVDAADPLGVGPTGTAVREGQPFWCQDFLAEPRTAAWHERGVRAGWAASAALPLRRGGVVVGSLTVYAAEVNAFDEDIRKLLLEMADDISFALESYRMRQALATAAELLERTSEMPRSAGGRSSCRRGICSGLGRPAGSMRSIPPRHPASRMPTAIALPRPARSSTQRCPLRPRRERRGISSCPRSRRRGDPSGCDPRGRWCRSTARPSSSSVRSRTSPSASTPRRRSSGSRLSCNTR